MKRKLIRRLIDLDFPISEKHKSIYLFWNLWQKKIIQSNASIWQKNNPERSRNIDMYYKVILFNAPELVFGLVSFDFSSFGNFFQGQQTILFCRSHWLLNIYLCNVWNDSKRV